MRVLIQVGSGTDVLGVVGQQVSLDENETHHLRVRRARDHESVEVLDGAGLRGTGLLIQAGKQWLVEVRAAGREAPPPELTLAVAAGDRDRFSWMVEKAVELGVTGIVPLETARSAGVATGLKGAHLRRLRRVTLESLKQCGAAWAPQVEEPVSLDEFLHRPLVGSGWLADRSGAPPPSLMNHGPLTVVIGPEGGLTDAERAALIAAGYVGVVLGPHTLRFETAALAATAAAAMGRMRGSHG
jgi:16S rRNA (uracil1498-N3)-methyltransferase